MTTNTRRIHPFDIAVAQYTGFLQERDKHNLTMSSPKFVDEEKLPDGRTRMILFLPSGGVYLVTFNQEWTWCIKEIDFLKKINYVFQRNPPPLLSFTKEMLKEYRPYATNRTQCVRRYVSIGRLRNVRGSTHSHSDQHLALRTSPLYR